MLTVKDVMTASPRTISVHEKVIVAKQVMSKYSIRHIPVTEKADLIGIISDRDLKLAQAIVRPARIQ